MRLMTGNPTAKSTLQTDRGGYLRQSFRRSDDVQRFTSENHDVQDLLKVMRFTSEPLNLLNIALNSRLNRSVPVPATLA